MPEWVYTPAAPGVITDEIVTSLGQDERGGRGRRMRYRPARRGGAFTLIELLVVIAILMLLLTLLTPVFRNAREHARITVCASNLSTCHQGVETYVFNNHMTYPVGYIQLHLGPSWAESEPPYAQVRPICKMAGKYISSSPSVDINNPYTVDREVPAWVCPNATGNAVTHGSYSPNLRFARTYTMPVDPDYGAAENYYDLAYWIGPHGPYHKRGGPPAGYRPWEGPESERALLYEAYIGRWSIDDKWNGWDPSEYGWGGLVFSRHLDNGMNILLAGGAVKWAVPDPEILLNGETYYWMDYQDIHLFPGIPYH